MLDINKLHDVIEGRIRGRRCGRTTAMLTTALGLADFDVPRVFILCGNTENAERCLRQMLMVALEMKFVAIQELPANILQINSTMYCFRATLTPLDDSPVFQDDSIYACGGLVMNHTPPSRWFYEMLNNRN